MRGLPAVVPPHRAAHHGEAGGGGHRGVRPARGQEVAVSNYPDYTWAGDPRAPWNEPDEGPEWEDETDDPRIDAMREEGYER